MEGIYVFLNACREEICQLIKDRLMDHIRCLEGGRTHNLQTRMDATRDMTLHLSLLLPPDSPLINIESLVRDSLIALESCALDIPCTSTPMQPPYIKTAGRGCPKFDIPFEMLDFFVEANFKVRDISNILHISERTVKRRLQEFDLGIRSRYSDITDEQLGHLVGGILCEHPNIGYRSIQGHLQSMGHRLQEKRIRNAVRMSDPEGSLFRRLFLRAVRRRTYNVKSPQALWHIDGYHKLIR